MKSLADKLTSGFSRLLSKKSGVDDDPLTNLRTVANWVDNLPVGDAYKCQHAIIDELRRFNEQQPQLTKHRLSVLMMLDEKSRDLQDTLSRQYLRNPRMSRSVESQLWHAVYGLYWEIARGYHAFVLHYAREAGRTRHESLIPLVTLRAIGIFGQLLKWRAIRYMPAGEKLWLRLHNLYSIAEAEDFHQKVQRAYPNHAAESSCETAYLHILMLNLADSGTLYPKQLDLLDQWLANWHRPLQLNARLDINVHNFAIDLSADHGPRRVRKPNTDKPMRFWATADLLSKLERLQEALREGSSPAELGLTENARTAETLDMLAHLHRQWSPLATREQRRAPRASIKRLADVAHGLSAVINQIKMPDSAETASVYNGNLDKAEIDDVQIYGYITDHTRERVSQMKPLPHRNSHEVERWVMQDESACGFGAVVESSDKDWLRVGALTSVKSHDAPEWTLGIVRRLSRVNDDTSSVGIETLPETPLLAMLYETATSGYTVDGFDNSSGGQPHASLWLEDKSGAVSVIIDPIAYMPHRVFRVRGVPGHELIALSDPIERSEGWMRVATKPVSD
ncbi:MAG: hypothetical protein R6W97_12155 [Thiobacillus sp.]